MRHYYIAEGDQQYGPFTLEEVKQMGLKKSTLVWTEGLQDWTTADTLDELKGFIISKPPPLPQKRMAEIERSVEIKLTNPKIPADYTKETEATVVGVFLLVILFGLKLGTVKFKSEQDYNEGRAFLAIASLAIRILVTIWVIGIAERQNRNSTGWGWFAFILPSISLIIVGLLNRKPLKISVDSSLSVTDQILILKSKADELMSKRRFSEALTVLNRIKEMKEDYPGINGLIDKCKLEIEAIKSRLNNERGNTKNELVLYDYTTREGRLQIEQSHDSHPDIYLGRRAFLNGSPAPSGKYRLGFLWYVYIENGVVTRVRII